MGEYLACGSQTLPQSSGIEAPAAPSQLYLTIITHLLQLSTIIYLLQFRHRPAHYPMHWVLFFHSLQLFPKTQEENPVSFWSSCKSLLLPPSFPYSPSIITIISSLVTFKANAYSSKSSRPLDRMTIQTTTGFFLALRDKGPVIFKQGSLPVSQCPPLLLLHTTQDTLSPRPHWFQKQERRNGGLAFARVYGKTSLLLRQSDISPLEWSLLCHTRITEILGKFYWQP